MEYMKENFIDWVQKLENYQDKLKNNKYQKDDEEYVGSVPKGQRPTYTHSCMQVGSRVIRIN